MKRRTFLQVMLAAGVAPAAIGTGILMPVKKIITPNTKLITANQLPFTAFRLTGVNTLLYGVGDVVDFIFSQYNERGVIVEHEHKVRITGKNDAENVVDMVVWNGA